MENLVSLWQMWLSRRIRFLLITRILIPGFREAFQTHLSQVIRRL